MCSPPEAVLFALTDIFAASWFLFAWLIQSWLAESSPWARRSLNHAMTRAREDWIRQMSKRDLRMIDTSIMQGLQNGTAFFASTSLLALGGCFALLNASDKVLAIVADLPFEMASARGAYEVKTLCLGSIYAYAFFKFGWAYRLFNYASILVGAVPGRDHAGTPDMEAAILRATRLVQYAGTHFNRGLRAFFMSVGFLGWYFGPYALTVSATLVLIVLVRRQFFSKSRNALYGALS